MKLRINALEETKSDKDSKSLSKVTERENSKPKDDKVLKKELLHKYQKRSMLNLRSSDLLSLKNTVFATGMSFKYSINIQQIVL